MAYNSGFTGSDMSIKSDKWIRRMAEQHGMIEPFEPGQVRYDGDRKLISYGTSSYGYDGRCSNEFKIFTNINTTIVDPKDFNPRSLVDFVGDECIRHGTQRGNGAGGCLGTGSTVVRDDR